MNKYTGKCIYLKLTLIFIIFKSQLLKNAANILSASGSLVPAQHVTLPDRYRREHHFI